MKYFKKSGGELPFYHIRIEVKTSESPYSRIEYELDLSEEDINLFGEQYGRGDVFFNRRWIAVSNIEEIEIRKTLTKSTFTIAYPSGSADIFYGDKKEVEIVTRQFIITLPKKMTRKVLEIKSKNVFIVHGRNHKPMKELQKMIKEYGLTPIILHEQASGSRTIVEKLERYSDVGYAFVILTPDDVGYCQSDVEDIWSTERNPQPKLKDVQWAIKNIFFGSVIDGMEELFSKVKERARQNVVLEFGYFIGKLGRDRVCCLYKGDIELPSDMHGIVYMPFKDSIDECQNKIIKELEEAGYEIKI